MKNYFLFILFVLLPMISIAQSDLEDLFAEGRRFQKQKDDAQAIFHFNKIVLAENIKTKEGYYLQYKSCLGLAHIYINQAKNKIAIEYLEKAEKICIEKIYRQYLLVYVYNNFAIIYQNQKRYKIALEYYHKAETISLVQKDAESLGKIYNNIGKTYYYTEDYSSSLNYAKKSIKYKEKANSKSIGNTYYLLAKIYRETGEFNLSENFFEQAIKENEFYNSSPNSQLADIYLGDGKLKAKENDSKCLELFEKSTQISKNIYGNKHINIVRININTGDFYLKQNDFENALLYYQKAIISADNTFANTNWQQNPTNLETYSEIYLIYALKQKADALYQYSKTQDKQQQLLEKSFETYLLASNLIEISNNNYLNNQDKLSLIEYEKNTYNRIIDIAFQLNEITNDESYLETAFQVSDMSKSAVLVNVLLENEVLFNSMQNSSKYQEVRELEQEIGDLEYLINQTSNLEKKAELRGEKFALNKIYETKMNSFRNANFTEILNNYQNKISIKEIQTNLNKDETIIEYSITEDYVFIFAISKRNFKAVRVLRDNTFNNSLDFTIEHFSQQNSNNYTVSYINTMYKSFNNLYKSLIEPVRSIAKGKRLIIIPDEKLNLISFDVLLTQEKTIEFNEFENAAYLLYDYIISYAYSAQIKYYNFIKRTKQLKPIIAFAPTYQNVTDSSVKYSEQMRGISNLSNILGAIEEVEYISEVIETTKCFDSVATESNFYRQINDYEIVHLAMHSVTDEINSKFSGLVFNSDSNNIEILQNYEIQSLNILSSLVVLSGCNTGGGRLISGEGIMSIGRSFFLGGSRSIIMTLWSIPDKSSSKIIKSFYHYVSKNKPIDEALQLAKIDFLNNTDPHTQKLNPFFWAAYVVVGNNKFTLNKKNNTISNKNSSVKSYILPVFFLIILSISILFFMRKFAKKQKNSQF